MPTRGSGSGSPCEPPVSPLKAARAKATSHATIHVPIATKGASARTAAAPTIAPAAVAAATDTTMATVGSHPALASRSAAPNAPMAMNAPCPRDGIPAMPTAKFSPIAASTTYSPAAMFERRTASVGVSVAAFPAWRQCPASLAHAACRWQVSRWSLTMPTACMKA